MGDVYSPHHINNARRASSPPRQIHNARNAGVYQPLSIHGEGVADRPGGRSGGWGVTSGLTPQKMHAIHRSIELGLGESNG